MESKGLFFGCNGANGVVMYLKKQREKEIHKIFFDFLEIET